MGSKPKKKPRNKPRKAKKTEIVPRRIKAKEYRQNRFIEIWLGNKGNITKASKTLGINPSTFYDWIQEKDFQRRLIEAEQEINDYVRDKLMTKIDEGDTRSIHFYLQRRHPDFKPPSMKALRVESEEIKVEFIEY